MSANSRETRFAEILLPLPLKGTYTYRIPQDLNDEVGRGVRVVVQFGRRKFYTGIVLRTSIVPPKGYEAKYIYDVIDQEAVIDDRTLGFWNWVAKYYMCEPGEVMNAALPGGLKIESETVIIPNDEFQEVELDSQEEQVLALLETRQKLTAHDVSKALGSEQKAWRILRSMYEKGLVWFEELYHQRYRPKKVKYIQLASAYRQEEALKILFDKLEKKALRQLEVCMHYLRLCPEYQEIEKSVIVRNNSDRTALKSLTNKGIFIETEMEVDHLSHNETIEERKELSPLQQKVYEQILSEWKTRTVCLLKGVAASGKTLLYIELISRAISQGKQVLYLVPEIALSFQFAEQLRRIFGDQVLFTHSRYGSNERVEVYRKVLDGSCRVLVGARSAVFMPFKELGLIVVDEEHDTGYKQFDPAPRYNARDTAIYLATLYDECRVLLGSATPSFESIFNANTGKYGKVELLQRYRNQDAPQVSLVKRPALGHEVISNIFSNELLDEIKKCKENEEQVIIFHNQRGFVPQIECNKCGWTPKCVNCDISLTYYKGINLLKCHYCGFSRAPYDRCNACGDTHLSMSGYGTEKIEDELLRLIPEIRAERFDQSTVGNRNAYERLMGKFQSKEIDILIGTQMITKGMNFNNVSLVGVVNADQLMNFPDFRAFERAFQHILQAGGRAGRSGQQAKLMIQTHNPGGHLFQWLQSYGYDQLYDSQIAEREQFIYPPFSKLIKINLRSKNATLAEQAANALSDQLKIEFGHRILGPEKPYISKIRGYFQFNILYKFDLHAPYSEYRKSKERIYFFMKSYASLKQFRGKVRIQADVDPV